MESSDEAASPNEDTSLNDSSLPTDAASLNNSASGNEVVSLTEVGTTTFVLRPLYANHQIFFLIL
jgi:hypothetical protein